MASSETIEKDSILHTGEKIWLEPTAIVRLLDNACADIRAYRVFYLTTMGVTLIAAPSVLLNAIRDRKGIGASYMMGWRVLAIVLCVVAVLLVLIGLLKIAPDVSYKPSTGDKVNDFSLRLKILEAVQAANEVMAKKSLLEALNFAHEISDSLAEAKKWFFAGAIFAVAAVLVGLCAASF